MVSPFAYLGNQLVVFLLEPHKRLVAGADLEKGGARKHRR